MRNFFFLVSLLVACPAFSLQTYQNRNAERPSRWVYMYGDDKAWVVDAVSLDAEGWPHLESRDRYDKESVARQALDLRSQGLSLHERETLEEARVLRGSSGSSLWNVRNQWSEEWEQKYSQWVSVELDKTWWLRNGIATDCADVLYSARWIFARINGLPMANRLATGQWFTQDSVKREWASLPTDPDWRKDRRFLAALNYFLDLVYTHTLWEDSYPIAISPASLTPGAHHLSLHGDSGHTQFVYKVGLNSDELPVLTLNSTMPRAKRELMEYLFLNQQSDSKSSAFLKMRWPEYKNGRVGLKDPTQMPFYSTEQFAPEFITSPRKEFWQEVFYRLNPHFEFGLVAKRSLDQILDLFKQRIQIVEDGYRLCSSKPCRPNSADWEAWSTPSRDQRIVSSVEAVNDIRSYVENWEQFEPLLNAVVLEQEGYSFSLKMLMTVFVNRQFSSDPNEEPVLRWGIHPRGTALRLRAQIENSLRQREQKIAQNNGCRDAACVYGSEEFYNASTYAIDANLWEASSFYREYCGQFDKAMCEDLMVRLQSQYLESAGYRYKLTDWMSQASFFNSDPRVPKSLRYQGYVEQIPHMSFPMVSPNEILVYDRRLFFIKEGNTGRLRTPQGEWLPPQGEKIITLDIQDGFVWTMNGNRLFVRRDLNQTPMTFELKTQVDQAWAFGGSILIRSEGTIRLLRVGSGIAEVLQMSGAVTEFTHEGVVVVKAPSDAFFLIDMLTGQKIELGPRARFAQVRREDRSFFVKSTTKGEQRDICQLVDANGSSQMLNPVGNCLGFAVAQGVGFYTDNGRVFRRSLSNNRDENLGSDGRMWGHVIRFKDGNQDHFFCVSKSKMTELFRASSAYWINDCSENYFIEVRSPEDWVVRRQSSGDVVFRSQGYIEFASFNWDEHYILSYKRVSALDRFSVMLADLNRPDIYSVLTDFTMAGAQYSYNRQNGLLLYKGYGAMWIGD